MNVNGSEFPEVYTPAEVAQLMRVDPKTVTRWAVAGKLNSFRTPGGHRRYFRSEVDALRGPAPYRADLTGHTVTVEHVGGGMAVVERHGGRLVKVAIPAAELDVPPEDAARIVADSYGAVYVPEGSAS